MANTPYTIFTLAQPGSAITAASATSMFQGPTPAAGTQKGVIPGNWLTYGTMMQIRAGGIISCAVTTPGTARYDVRFGSVVVWDGLAVLLNVVAQTNIQWQLEIDLLCIAPGTGTTATMRGLGKWTSPAGINSGTITSGPQEGPSLLPWNTANPGAGTGFDSTVPNVFDVFFTQTVTTGSMTCQYCSAVILNPNY